MSYGRLESRVGMTETSLSERVALLRKEHVWSRRWNVYSIVGTVKTIITRILARPPHTGDIVCHKFQIQMIGAVLGNSEQGGVTNYQSFIVKQHRTPIVLKSAQLPTKRSVTCLEARSLI
jgi:hypothetical protein